jgi:hypothetical protein
MGLRNKIVPRGKDWVRYRIWFEGEDRLKEKMVLQGRNRVRKRIWSKDKMFHGEKIGLKREEA